MQEEIVDVGQPKKSKNGVDAAGFGKFPRPQ